VSIPPLLFYAEVVLVLALAAGTAAWLAGIDPRGLAGRGRGLIRPYLERQQDIAHGLGVTYRNWIGLRLLATLGGLALGLTTGLTVAVIGGTLLGLFGLPWLLAGRAAKRRLQMEREVATVIRDIRNLMQLSNLSLDRTLREVGRSPYPHLGHALAPLRGDLPISDCLVAVSERARSPLVTMLTSALLISRTHNPMGFIAVADEVLVPLVEVTAEIQQENHATLAQQRAAALAIGVILAVLFAAVMRVPTMHAYYDTILGQLTLTAVVGIYLGLVWLIRQVARPIPWTRWDMRAVKRETDLMSLG
jgi:hypothetical protein